MNEHKLERQTPLNLEEYESVFDAVIDYNYDINRKKHSLLDVLDLPILDKNSDSFKVQDLKRETLDLKSGEFKYFTVNKESKLKCRFLKIYKDGNKVVYSNVTLKDSQEINLKEMYSFDFSDNVDWLQMYIEILYEIKHFK